MKTLRSLYVNWRRRRIYGAALAGPARGVILRYHSVGEPEAVGRYLDPGLSVSPECFREHLEVLRRHCRVVGPEEMTRRLSGRDDGPLAVWITFDDGYRDNHDHATALLADAGLTATFYITTGPLNSDRGLWISELWRLVPRLPAGASTGLPDDFPRQVPEDSEGRRLLRRRVTRWFAGMTADEREGWLDHLARLAGVPRGEGLEQSFLTPELLRRMQAAGMTIGAHSRSHPHLDHLDPTHHAEEVLGSKEDLEQILGAEVPDFAYPNPSGGGRFGEQARASVAAAGFRTAVTSTPGPLGPETDRLRLPRIGVYAGSQQALVYHLLARAGRR